MGQNRDIAALLFRAFKQVTLLDFRFQVLIAFLLGLIIPCLSVIAIDFSEAPFAGGMYESGKYSVPALGLLEEGRYGYFYDDGRYEPELSRLIIYPAFLAFSFLLAGGENYTVVVLLQTLLAASTVVLVGLSVRMINANWYWPGVLISSSTLGIGYSASIVMPETVSCFLIAGVMYGALSILKGKNIATGLWILCLAAGFAYATRPAFLVLPIALSIAIFFTLCFERRFPIKKSSLIAVAPLIVCGVVAIPQIIWIHSNTGHFSYTLQSGNALLEWVYPCLRTNFGCGALDNDFRNEAVERFETELAQLPENKQSNLAVQNSLAEKVGLSLIAETPYEILLVNGAGSAAKLMLHTTAMPILERLELKQITISGGIADQGPNYFPMQYIRDLLATPHMWIWAGAQAMLLVARCFQLIGIVSGLLDPRLRWVTLTVLVALAGLLAPTLGMGNPRYRVPMEPFLAFLTVVGFSAVRFKISAAKTGAERKVDEITST